MYWSHSYVCTSLYMQPCTGLIPMCVPVYTCNHVLVSFLYVYQPIHATMYWSHSYVCMYQSIIQPCTGLIPMCVPAYKCNHVLVSFLYQPNISTYGLIPMNASAYTCTGIIPNVVSFLRIYQPTGLNQPGLIPMYVSA